MHKLYHILSHPAMMLASVSVLVIAGESSAGIFAQFLVMNLITLKLFAVVGAVGLLVLFAAYCLLPPSNQPFSHALMNVLGVLLLMSSVALFMYSLPWYNVDQTFTTFVPFCTLLLASASTVAYGLKFLWQLFTCSDKQKKKIPQ